MDKIILCEEPHFVIQGEGNLIGKKMLLLRVAGCNLKCNDCDTPHSWNTPSIIPYTYAEFVEMIRFKKIQIPFEYVMITGGAPSLYKDFLYCVIHNNEDLHFQIEDAGDTDWGIFKNLPNVYFSFSPKIGALEGATKITDWKAFENLPLNWICKVVVEESSWNSNLSSIKNFQAKYNIPDSKIYLMPKGIDSGEIIRGSQFVIDKCWEYGFNFTTRLHILLYGNKRLV